MNFVDLIIKKRDGHKLSKKEINFFIKQLTNDTIPDYQVSAMLMAIYFSSMDVQETTNLTMAMANSGTIFDLSSVKGFKLDKHSTGGVADTTTLILAPLVASLGVPVVKMSGRGLGFSGGTLDKLESIPNFRIAISEEEALKFVKTSNVVIMSQNESFTPSDKKLYALRDVTGTVDSMPLIAASIMSKKIAVGTDCIVLDVKCGNGAFMKDIGSATELANIMTNLGKQTGRKVTTIISNMDQPLGQYIGNSLEVMEAIGVLKGVVTGDLLDCSLLLGAHMLLLAEKVKTEEEGRALLLKQIENGKGLEKFRELIAQQGGNPNIVDTPMLLPLSKEIIQIHAKEAGYVYEMDTEKIGRASVETGAGRLAKDDVIDPGAGIIMKKRIGEYVEVGEIIAEIFSGSKDKCKKAEELLKMAITIKDIKPREPKLILDIIQ